MNSIKPVQKTVFVLKISREIKTAILVLGAIFLFIFGFSYLKGKNVFSSAKAFHTEFDFNALETGSPVTIKGFHVGRVEEVSYNPENEKVAVRFTVESNFKFSTNSIVRLYEIAPMAGNALAIIARDGEQMAESGAFLKSEIKKGLVNDLKDKFADTQAELNLTLKTADTLLHNLNRLVKDESEKGLQNAIAELNATMKSFKNVSYTLNKMMKDDRSKLNNMISSFTSAGEKFGKVADSLEQANIGKTMASLDKTLVNLNKVLSGIEEGKGTMGKLMKDDKLYNNFEATSKELEELLRDIKLHPKRYFRILSKKEIPYQEETKN